jgi:hypothetical protein
MTQLMTQLAEIITRSQFGLCYFSEPQRETGGYKDNPNVVFEAGMLHTTILSNAEPSGWIPLRENKSPPLPFELASERIFVVPRTADGRLNEELFHVRLRARIQLLLADAP